MTLLSEVFCSESKILNNRYGKIITIKTYYTHRYLKPIMWPKVIETVFSK